MTATALHDDGEIPDGMRRVCRRFERWRKGHEARLPVPEGLWASAAQAARKHGVFRTAKVLRLEYGKLKRMMESAAPSPKRTAVHRVRPARFLELIPPREAPCGPGRCGAPPTNPCSRACSNSIITWVMSSPWGSI